VNYSDDEEHYYRWDVEGAEVVILSYEGIRQDGCRRNGELNDRHIVCLYIAHTLIKYRNRCVEQRRAKSEDNAYKTLVTNSAALEHARDEHHTNECSYDTDYLLRREPLAKEKWRGNYHEHGRHIVAKRRRRYRRIGIRLEEEYPIYADRRAREEKKKEIFLYRPKRELLSHCRNEKKQEQCADGATEEGYKAALSRNIFDEYADSTENGHRGNELDQWKFFHTFICFFLCFITFSAVQRSRDSQSSSCCRDTPRAPSRRRYSTVPQSERSEHA